MKITVTFCRPRNPLVVLARGRRSGSHRPAGASQRQHAGRALSRELDQLKRSP
ncbi:MAG: hypothetical protein ABIQ60_13785 [Burkholderiaceae bacterium]